MSTQKRRIDTKRVNSWLAILALGVIVVAASILANINAQSREYVQDTDYTLRWNGSVWGDPSVNDGVATFSERLGILRSNPPYPPYYNISDNDTNVLVGNQWFGSCRTDNPILEIPAVKVECFLIGNAD